MRIVTLVDNVVYGRGLSAEHGLSLYIEHEGFRILFDTGQGDRFLQNAQRLGIDIAKVDALVLSHGHYDHTGGLEAFWKANKKAPVLIKEGFFEPKYNRDKKFIGTPYSAGLLEGRLRIMSRPQEVFRGVHLVTDIPLVNAWDTHFGDLFVVKNGDLQPDRFSDEQFLLIEEEGTTSVISGCSHRGITNILRSAAAFVGERRRPSPDLPSQKSGREEGAIFRLVLGGFHLHSADDEFADRVVRALDEFHIERLGCCHCTGIEHYARIKAVVGQRAFYAWTGTDISV